MVVVSCLPLSANFVFDSLPTFPGEKILGKWFAQTGRRSEIFLATKFGAMDLSEGGDRHRPNSKPAYIRDQIQKSLADLQTDYIDLYYQHRVDPEVPIEVVLETLRPFVESGTIKWIGLSEPSIATLKRAKAVKGVGEKVTAAQMEFSPFELYIEKTGFVDAINEAGMAVVAYSPLALGQYHACVDSVLLKTSMKTILGLSCPGFPKRTSLRTLRSLRSCRGSATSIIPPAVKLRSHGSLPSILILSQSLGVEMLNASRKTLVAQN